MSRVLEDTLVRFEHPLPGDRRHQVLRAGRDQGRGRLPPAARRTRADSVSFSRIVNSPRRGIGDTSQGRLALPREHHRADDLGGARAGRGRCPGSSAAAIKCGRPLPRDDGRAARPTPSDSPVAELLEAVLNETGYFEALEAERTVEAEGRIENLEELIGGRRRVRRQPRARGRERDRRRWRSSCSRSRCSPTRTRSRTSEALVTLMTLHNAKGLEYDTVFVIGCEEGVFPHSRALEEGGEEEERRLCYVGITRARQRLYLTWARERRLFGGAPSATCPRASSTSCPVELTERHGEPADRRSTSWGRPRAAGSPPVGRRRARASRSTPARRWRCRTGDDVVHASFGDGVVTGGRAGRGGRRALRRRRHRAQADGRLRADQEAVTDGGAGDRRQGGRRGGARAGARSRSPPSRRRRAARRAWRRCWSATTPPREIYVAQQAQGLRGGRDALGPPRARARRPPRRSCWSWSQSSAPTTTVDGILVQLPLPDHIDPDAVVAAIDPAKDVDGLTPASAGLLAHGTPGPGPVHARRGDGAARPRGGRAGGRRGGRRRPLEPGRRARLRGLLLSANATVTICHSRTRDLAAVCSPRRHPRRRGRRAARCSAPTTVKPGAAVIDVGMNRTEDGLVGDVDFDAVAEVAGGDHPGPRRRRPDDDRDAARNTLAAAGASASADPDARAEGSARPATRDATKVRSQAEHDAAKPQHGRRTGSEPEKRSPRLGGRCSSSVMFFDWFGARSRDGQRRSSARPRRLGGGNAWDDARRDPARPDARDRRRARRGGAAPVRLRPGAADLGHARRHRPRRPRALLILFRIVARRAAAIAASRSTSARQLGIFLGLAAALGIAYGGYRAMQEEGASFGGPPTALGGAGGRRLSVAAGAARRPAAGKPPHLAGVRTPPTYAAALVEQLRPRARPAWRRR